MDTSQAGDLVNVTAGGPPLAGIVFDVPSSSKVVVAVMDARRGPVFRTVHPDALSERSEPGPQDPALQLLLRRTPPPAPAKARGAARQAQGRAGYTRAAAHRPTGK